MRIATAVAQAINELLIARVFGRHLFLRWVSRFALTYLAFFAFQISLETIDLMRGWMEADLSTTRALMLAATAAPARLHGLTPVMALVATLWMFLNLARRTEIVAARAAGFSWWQLLAWPSLAAAACGALLVGLGDEATAYLKRSYDRQIAAVGHQTGRAVTVASEGLWLREASDEGQVAIRASRVQELAGGGALLSDVDVFVFSANGSRIAWRTIASAATWNGERWTLTQPARWCFDATGLEAPCPARSGAGVLPIRLTPEEIRSGSADPITVGFWQLGHQIARLENAGLSARLYRVFREVEIARPLLLMAMVLIAAAFTTAHVRGGQQGMRVVYAVVLGLGLYLFQNFTRVLGETGEWEAWQAAWVPAALGLGVGLALVSRSVRG